MGWRRFLEWLLALLRRLFPPRIVGITVKENALKAQCKVVKKTIGSKAALAVPSKLATGSFVLVDGGSGIFTTLGVDQAGNQVDISALATEVVTSDNPSLVVGTPSNMAVTLTPPATGVGSANVTFVATFNDSSVGPFSFVAAVSYNGGKIVDIVVVQS
jgi:hypothetical protein